MPPIDTIDHIDYKNLQPGDKTKLLKAFRDKRAHLQDVIKAMDKGIKALSRKTKR